MLTMIIESKNLHFCKGTMVMARKAQNGEVNKSAAIRDLLEQNPSIKAKEVVTTLGERGVKVAPGLVYFIKGKMKGKRGRREATPRPGDTGCYGWVGHFRSIGHDSQGEGVG